MAGYMYQFVRCIMALGFASLFFMVRDAHGQVYTWLAPNIGSPSQDLQINPDGFRANPLLQETASFTIGYSTTPGGLRAGYTGIVLPGACVSSYFAYNLRGPHVSGTIPFSIQPRVVGQLRASYLFAENTQANQDITWLHLPPGVRQWTWTRSIEYDVQGELAYIICKVASLTVGIRWESVTSRFRDPIPDYPFTVADMESGLSLSLYQPYFGLYCNEKIGKLRALLKVVGFPRMVGFLEHFNTCNNNGLPFAHIGSSPIRKGYFLEAHGEMGYETMAGLQFSGFFTLHLFRGTCPMNLERRDAGPPETTTSATVDFSYDRSNIAVGVRCEIPLSIGFLNVHNDV